MVKSDHVLKNICTQNKISTLKVASFCWKATLCESPLANADVTSPRMKPICILQNTDMIMQYPEQQLQKSKSDMFNFANINL